MSSLEGPVWLIGCGKMGGALAEGWLKAGLAPTALVVVDADAAVRSAWAQRGVVTLGDTGELATAEGTPPRALVLAVKPQQMTPALEALRGRLPGHPLILSIAAGTPLAAFEAVFGAEGRIVRAMPNTPAAIGRGASALIANAAADAEACALAEELMGAVGMTVWLDDEAAMHAVTAVSGSGPAYVFLLIEAMAAAGVREGLAPDLALELARATVAGAGLLAEQEATTAPATLRANVTSPGGTTAAAIAELEGTDGMVPLIARAIHAAARRSAELAAAAGHS